MIIPFIGTRRNEPTSFISFIVQGDMIVDSFDRKHFLSKYNKTIKSLSISHLAVRQPVIGRLKTNLLHPHIVVLILSFSTGVVQMAIEGPWGGQKGNKNVIVCCPFVSASIAPCTCIALALAFELLINI
jgi:hypothetical protein